MIPARAIRCKIFITIRFPHPLEATGKVMCSGRVARITLRVTIFRGSRVVRSRAFTKTSVRGLERTIATRCVSGRYLAAAAGKVRTRSGNILRGSVRTHRVRVRC